MPPRIWNSRRQILGNGIPLVFGLAVGAGFVPFGPSPRVVLGIIATYMGINFWGWFENAKIESELRNRTQAQGELIGFVFKIPPSIFDAHAEVGLLSIQPERLNVETEDGGFVILREEIVSISRGMNIHRILLLGGWVVIELRDGQFFRLESRKFNSMLAGKQRTNRLFQELTLWQSNKNGPA